MTKRMRRIERTTALLLCLAIATAGLAPLSAPPDGGETGIVRGKLIDSNGEPLVGYTVKVRDRATGTLHEGAPTGTDGKFEIADLPPASYTYEIFDPEGRLVPVRIEPITVEAGAVLTQPIAIVPSKNGGEKMMAFLIGGGLLLPAIIVINNQDDDDNGRLESLTKSAP